MNATVADGVDDVIVALTGAVRTIEAEWLVLDATSATGAGDTAVLDRDGAIEPPPDLGIGVAAAADAIGPPPAAAAARRFKTSGLPGETEEVSGPDDTKEEESPIRSDMC